MSPRPKVCRTVVIAVLKILSGLNLLIESRRHLERQDVGAAFATTADPACTDRIPGCRRILTAVVARDCAELFFLCIGSFRPACSCGISRRRISPPCRAGADAYRDWVARNPNNSRTKFFRPLAYRADVNVFHFSQFALDVPRQIRPQAAFLLELAALTRLWRAFCSRRFPSCRIALSTVHSQSIANPTDSSTDLSTAAVRRPHGSRSGPAAKRNLRGFL